MRLAHTAVATGALIETFITRTYVSLEPGKKALASEHLERLGALTLAISAATELSDSEAFQRRGRL